MATLHVKDWEDFQHYRKRRPPWIKLHKSLLDNFEFHGLPVESKALLPLIWLLASEYEDGKLPWHPEKLAYRLRTTEAELAAAVNPLVDAGFLGFEGLEQDASNVLAQALAPCKQDARLEEKRREEKRRGAAPSAQRPDTWLTPFIDAWNPLGDLQGSVAAKPLRALIRKHGARQVLATWKGYCDEAEQAAKAGRSFSPSPQHFARTYGTLKAKWAQVVGEHGDWEPIPDEPEEVAA